MLLVSQVEACTICQQEQFCLFLSSTFAFYFLFGSQERVLQEVQKWKGSLSPSYPLITQVPSLGSSYCGQFLVGPSEIVHVCTNTNMCSSPPPHKRRLPGIYSWVKKHSKLSSIK